MGRRTGVYVLFPCLPRNAEAGDGAEVGNYLPPVRFVDLNALDLRTAAHCTERRRGLGLALHQQARRGARICSESSV